MKPHQIRIATRADLPAMVEILLRAFEGDPVARYFWPETEAYLAAYPRHADVLLSCGIAQNAAYLACAGGAVSVWLPPNGTLDLVALRAVMNETVSDSKRRVLGQVGEQTASFRPKEPHWYLALIGTDPSLQGSGLGSSLLSNALKQCDQSGDVAYLESSSAQNVPFYEARGFKVLGTIQPEDFPPLFPMRRQPLSSGES